jgi:shikimate dehydrogenase
VGGGVLQKFTRKKGRTRLIVSFHDFSGTPSFSVLERRLKQIKAARGDVAKVVTRLESVEDLQRIKSLLDKAVEIDQPLAAFGMGSLGRFSRVLAPTWGSVLSYAALGEGKEAAPGQMTGYEMRRLFKKGVDPAALHGQSELYGVLGSPVGHSLSPVIHNAAFRHLDLDSFYVPVDIEDADLAFHCVRAFHFQGLSVTLPHKLSIMEDMDEIESSAETLGAVNTVHLLEGKYIGGNTDWLGLLKALEEHTTLQGKSVLLAGAGGAARAAVYGLTKAGARVTVTNRTQEKGRQLASEFGAGFRPPEELRSAGADILVNATPLGMIALKDQTPFPAGLLESRMIVMDMVYAPAETRLLREARQAGCRVVGGLSMLLNQAAFQFEAWTTLPAPLDIMRTAAEKALEEEHDLS